MARYSDLDLNFIAHPVTGDVSKLTDEESVKRAVRNLILTNFYDYPFEPTLGSSVMQQLFENANPITAIGIENAIREVIINFEPRVEIIDIVVIASLDEHSYDVSIIFTVINIPQPVTLNLFLERLR